MTPSLELWGGPECTVNRVGDDYGDQFRSSGHDRRIDDLDRFADLGLRVLRYPILWEKIEVSPGVFDWSWADARMERIRALGMRPIIGLLHHGSGPRWTSLLHDDFVEGLERFAGAVAERYPWVQDWTPVNEPLTTARFSAMYGHWFPHARSEIDLWTALFNQVEGIRAAMRAIRRVIPGARLVQTEDFGTTFGTEPCADQVRHENQRRLVVWDLLAGLVTRDHPLRRHLGALGWDGVMDRMAAEPCPADVIGLNHYATSDRFLDHRLDLYRPDRHGGNGRLRYADVEAVRVLEDHPGRGWAPIFSQLDARYGCEIAVTECHLGCEPDEQVRWLFECWNAALEARRDGIDVSAVTVWALLGSFDWDSLLTRSAGHYEAGAFDVSTGHVRLTPFGEVVRTLGHGGTLATAHQIFQPIKPGWWRRSDRFDPAPANCATI